MSTQPEALRLADALETHLGGNTARHAAAELRRLHEVNQELLEALQTVMGDANYGQKMTWEQRCGQARTALAKVGGPHE